MTTTRAHLMRPAGPYGPPAWMHKDDKLSNYPFVTLTCSACGSQDKVHARRGTPIYNVVLHEPGDDQCIRNLQSRTESVKRELEAATRVADGRKATLDAVLEALDDEIDEIVERRR